MRCRHAYRVGEHSGQCQFVPLIPSVGQQHLVPVPEFIALGMTAKVIMVIQNQDASIRNGLAIKPSRRQTANTTAYHHQVVLGDSNDSPWSTNSNTIYKVSSRFWFSPDMTDTSIRVDNLHLRGETCLGMDSLKE